MKTLATIDIDFPGRFASFVLPFKDGEMSEEALDNYRVVVDDWTTHEKVVAQMEVAARYASGSIQTLHCLAAFTNRPYRVAVFLAGADEPMPEVAPFVWHPDAREIMRRFHDAATSDERTLAGGHVAIVKRFALTTRGVSSICFLTAFTGCSVVRVDMGLHNALANASEIESARILLFNGVNTFGMEFIPSVIPEPLLAYGDSLQTPDVNNGPMLFVAQRQLRPVRGTIELMHKFSSNPLEVNMHRPEVKHDAGFGIATARWRNTAAYTALESLIPDYGTRTIQHTNALEGREHVAAAAHFDGTPWPYPASTDAVRLGLSHPGSVHEGGMTGGWLINALPGVDWAAASGAAGLRYYMHEQRFMLDRTHVALLENNGNNATLEAYKGKGNWKFRQDDQRFAASGTGTLDAPWSFSTGYKVPAGKNPHADALKKFEPIDFAHLVRLHGSTIALSYLANDFLSKWILRGAGELARMSLDNGQLDADDKLPTERGVYWSRIQGWQFRMIAEAYRFAGNGVRERWSGTMRKIARIACEAAMPNGFVSCQTTGKEAQRAPYNLAFGVCQNINVGLLGSSLFAIDSSLGLYAYPALDFAYLKQLDYILVDSPNGGANTLWSCAVRPKALADAPYESIPVGLDGFTVDSRHPDHTGGAYDNEQTRYMVGVIGQRAIKAQDSNTIQRCIALTERMLGPTPTATLLGMGASALDSDSVLLAFCQAVGLP